MDRPAPGRQGVATVTSPINVSLDGVIVSVTDEAPRILTVRSPQGLRVPSGLLEPERDRTLELAVRRWVSEQTGIELGYVEQLYTFGDLGRRPEAEEPGRVLSVAYLALVEEQAPSEAAEWSSWYGFLPWEDHRDGAPACLVDVIVPRLRQWSRGVDTREARTRATFGLDGFPWDGVRALERYELLYEADLVAESYLDGGRAAPEGLPAATAMFSDHRRIVATALGRLRGKLTYRPVVFELMPETFTLWHLQRVVEALAGIRLHKQNFRRLVERSGLVEGTGQTAATGGRPAELFRFRREVTAERPRPGLGHPWAG